MTEYTPEQRAAINDLVEEYINKFTHTVGERIRIRDARTSLLTRKTRSFSRRLTQALSNETVEPYQPIYPS
jgi:hypothetical protein